MKLKDQNKIVNSYAEALYDTAYAEGVADKILAQTLVFRAKLAEKKEITDYLANPIWNNQQKSRALGEIAKREKLCAPLAKLLQIMAENGRSGWLVKVLDGFEKIYYNREGIAVVNVKTAVELSKTQSERLAKAMKKYVGGEVVINYDICPEVLGGLAVEVGSELIDDTIKGKLKRLEVLMKGTV